MKKISIIMAIMLTALVAYAQQQSGIIEIPIDGKIFIKTNRFIYNKLDPEIDPLSKGHSMDYISSITSEIYLLNSDDELKKAIRGVFPKEILDRVGEDRITLRLRITPDGRAYNVTFLFSKNSSLYDTDIKIFSDLEDVIKSTFRFNIPDSSVPSYYFIFTTSKLSHLTNNEPFLPLLIYRKR